MKYSEIKGAGKLTVRTRSSIATKIEYVYDVDFQTGEISAHIFRAVDSNGYGVTQSWIPSDVDIFEDDVLVAEIFGWPSGEVDIYISEDFEKKMHQGC